MATMPIRGREHELGVLATAVEDAVRGRGAVLVVEGEAGIGKSRLLAEIADIGNRAGLVVASGAADELDELAPLASFRAALRASSSPLLPAGLLDGVSGYSDQRLALLERLGASIEEHARQAPVLIAVDDLQWADSATLLAVRVLTLQLVSYPVVWLLARRPHPTSVALERTIEQLSLRGARRLTLSALDGEAIAALVHDLLGAPPDESLLTFLDGANGNPFYLTELLNSTSLDGGLTIDAGHAVVVEHRIPTAFQHAIAAKLGSLDDSTREFLQFGSMFGRRFGVRDVAELLDRPSAQLALPIEEAMAENVIAEDGSDLVFRHDLLRQAVYENIPASLREALHLDIARRMLARGASPADAASHLVLAARRGDAETLDLLARAGDELVPTAPAAAADLKLQTLELMDRGSLQWARTTSDALRLLSITGRSRQAQEVGRSALETRLDPTARAMIQIGLTHALSTLGLYLLVLPNARELLAVPNLPDDMRLEVVSMAAAAAVRAGDPSASVMVEEELALAASLDSQEHRVLNLGNQCHLAARRGDLGVALALSKEESAIAESGAPARSTVRASRLSVAFTLLLLDRTEEAREEYSLAQREAREIGYPWVVMFCEQGVASTLLIEGQLDDAGVIAEAALEDARAVDLDLRTPDLLHLLAQVAIRRGELGLARRHADRLVALLDQGGSLISTVRNTVSGRLAFAEGDPGRALRDLESVYDAPPLTTLLRNDCPLAPELVRIALAAGSTQHAQRMVAAATDFADRNPDIWSITAQAAHAAALVHDDMARLRDAAELYERSPRLLARADVANDLANAHVRREEHDEAIELFKHAFTQYSALGARRDADRTRAQLRELGVRLRTSEPTERPSTGWASLTTAEQNVARLAGEALTNRQIAERLYLSPHTVTTHLRHIFTKLEIRSRVELARLVAA
jgi:DNA-binding CsgD family transcriptional regulator